MAADVSGFGVFVPGELEGGDESVGGKTVPAFEDGETPDVRVVLGN